MASYNRVKKKFWDAFLGSDSLKVAFVTNSYTPNIDTNEFWSDISANEASASGYTSGGITLTGLTSTVDTADDEEVVGANNASFTLSANLTYRYIVVYKYTGNNATSPLIFYQDDTARTLNTGTVNININAEGLININ